MKPKIKFLPLDGWPDELTPADEREFGTFKVTYSKNIEELEKELRIVKAQDATIYLDVMPTQIRLDGFLRADAQPGHPGVMISFFTPGQEGAPTVVHSDQYRTWHHNLRGIALTLEALRGINRWGAGKRGQQYTGFKLAKVSGPGASTPLARSASLFGSAGEALKYLAFVAESAHWETDHSSVAAINEAIELAKKSATSPAQLRLVEAAAALVQGK